MLHQKIRPNYIQKFAKTIQKFVQIFPMSACFGQGRPWIPKRGWSLSSYIFLNGCKYPCTPSHSIHPGTYNRNSMFWLVRSILHGHLRGRRFGAPSPKTRCDHLPKNSPVGFFPGIRPQDLYYRPAVRTLILSPYFRTAMNNRKPMIRYTTDMIW